MCGQACLTVRPAISLLLQAAPVVEDIVLRAHVVLLLLHATPVVEDIVVQGDVVLRVHADGRCVLQCELRMLVVKPCHTEVVLVGGRLAHGLIVRALRAAPPALLTLCSMFSVLCSLFSLSNKSVTVNPYSRNTNPLL